MILTKLKNNPNQRKFGSLQCPILSNVCTVFKTNFLVMSKEILGQACRSHANQTSHRNVHKTNNKYNKIQQVTGKHSPLSCPCFSLELSHCMAMLWSIDYRPIDLSSGQKAEHLLSKVLRIWGCPHDYGNPWKPPCPISTSWTMNHEHASWFIIKSGIPGATLWATCDNLALLCTTQAGKLRKTANAKLSWLNEHCIVRKSQPIRHESSSYILTSGSCIVPIVFNWTKRMSPWPRKNPEGSTGPKALLSCLWELLDPNRRSRWELGTPCCSCSVRQSLHRTWWSSDCVETCWNRRTEAADTSLTAAWHLDFSLMTHHLGWRSNPRHFPTYTPGIKHSSN